MMPPRSKRKRAASARVTRSKAQAPGAPSKSLTTKAQQTTKDGPKTALGPSTRRTRANLLMEVVLPASKRPTPKTSSALTPVSPVPSASMGNIPDLPDSSPLRLSQPIRESTPQVGLQNKG